MTEIADWRLEHLQRALEVSGIGVEELILPREGDLLADGIRLHYLDWGGAARRSILFLHGGGLTAHTWDLVCLALRPRFRCYALDLRGHGDSEWSPNMQYGLNAYAHDVERVAKALELRDFVMFGMSLGGLISLAYAGQHAARLRLLVVVDVGPTVHPEGARKIRDFMLESGELDSVEDFVSRASHFNPRRDPELLKRSLMHNLRQVPNGKSTWKYDRRHREQRDHPAADRRRQELWNDVAKITCPTLIVRGEKSDVFTTDDAIALSTALPNGRWVEVAGAGHTVQGDNPRGLLEKCEPFLAPLA